MYKRQVLEKSADAKARVYVAAAITRGLNGEALCGMEQLAEAGDVYKRQAQTQAPPKEETQTPAQTTVQNLSLIHI